jgi:hypothetical protein
MRNNVASSKHGADKSRQAMAYVRMTDNEHGRDGKGYKGYSGDSRTRDSSRGAL